ncbi:MAG: addiction module antitoxin [Blastochloris sp.]|nr:addiction module antitoxin [Blastochloris sp.]
MQRKLTITLDEAIYEGLHKVIGRRKISQFIEALVRPHVTMTEREAGYAAMAADEAREAEALAWSEGTVGDSRHEAQ